MANHRHPYLGIEINGRRGTGAPCGLTHPSSARCESGACHTKFHHITGCTLLRHPGDTGRADGGICRPARNFLEDVAWKMIFLPNWPAVST